MISGESDRRDRFLTRGPSPATLCGMRFRLVMLLAACLLLAACYTPSGEYGGNIDADPSGPYGIRGADVVKSEEVGTGFGPFGGVYNYEEVDFGPPSS